MAVVVQAEKGRIYIPPTAEMEEVANQASAHMEARLHHFPTTIEIFGRLAYGFTTFGRSFHVATVGGVDDVQRLVTEARERILQDALAAGLSDDGRASKQAALAPMPTPKLSACISRSLQTRLRNTPVV